MDASKIQTVFLTHSHGDHIRGLAPLLEETRATLVHRNGLKLRSFLPQDPTETLAVESKTSYEQRGCHFFPFDLYHDAPCATGYHFKIGGTRFTLITDTGKTDEGMLHLAARADVLFLEANYCPQMLAAGPYPPLLRERVSSDLGHLSNHQASDFLNVLSDRKRQDPSSVLVKSVYLVHLSANNNSPEQVQQTLAQTCRWSGPIRICDRDELVMGEVN